ncbi:MAG: DUF2726 domain-containing protein [Roseiflexaceae bacterium]
MSKTGRHRRSTIGLIRIIEALMTARDPQTQPATPVSSHPVGHYAVVPTMLTATEQQFAGVLHDILPSEYQYMVQVSLHRVVHLRRMQRHRQWLNPRWNRISQKSLDFVIVRTVDSRIMMAIELDDASHERADRIARDELLDAIMQDAGLPLVHIPTRIMYDRMAVQQQIMPFLTNQ